MNDDIKFYSFDVELLYILPVKSINHGYSSVVATIELNGNGAFEMIFYDDDLKRLIENNPDNIIVIWRDFQGFITGFSFSNECRLFGMHLNGLLRRATIPILTETTNTAEEIAREAISGIDWLALGIKQGFDNDITYQTSSYTKADKYIQNLLALDNAGYLIALDTVNKQFSFQCIKSQESELMLCENNLNAHNIEINYDNKELTFGGWYKEDQLNDTSGNSVGPIWKYITTDKTKTGIHKIDTVLSSTTATEALNELKALKPMYEISAETKGIFHNSDYRLGDIIRLQKDGVTVKRIVTGVNMWNETSYGEEPVLSEFTNIEEV